LSSDEITKALVQAIDLGDDVMLNVAKNALISRGRQQDDTAVQAIRSALANVPEKIQAYLIGILGEIATPASVATLLDILNASAGSGTRNRNAVLQAIGTIGQYREEAISPQALLSPLESYFDTATSADSDVLIAVARAFSSVGTAEGVDRLLQFVEAQADEQPEAVQQVEIALLAVRNPEAVPPLQNRIQHDSELRYKITRTAGDTLAAMGAPQATTVLLQWAAEVTGAAQTDQALTWLSQVRDQQSLNLLLEASQRFRFHDQTLVQKISALAEQISNETTPSRE